MRRSLGLLFSATAAALALTIATATAASATTWRFDSRNNYADASGTIFYCDGHDRGTCFPDHDFVVTLELTGTSRYTSTSYAYLTYWIRDGRDRRRHQELLASVRNGQTVRTSHKFPGYPYSAQVTVCTQRSSHWYCGNPSPA